jgi:hypothetical protein
MPELNFNALIPRQDFFQGYSEGQQQQNLLAQQAQARQLGDIQIKNAMREQQNAEAEAEAVKGASTLEEMAKRYRAAGLGKQALATEAAISKQKTDRLTQAKSLHDLLKGTANKIVSNPELAQQSLMNYARQTGEDVNDDLQLIQSYGGDLNKIRQWASGIAIEADKLTPKFHSLTIPGKGVQTGTTDISGKFTPGELFAEQMSEYQKAQNRIAQQRLAFDQNKFAWEKANPGYEIREDADGNTVGVNKRTLQAFPVTIGGGGAPAAAPAVSGAGMPGPRVAQPGVVQAIPGMTSVLDQTAPAIAPAAAPVVGGPRQLVGKAKEAPAKFHDIDMQLSGLAGSLKSFKDEIKNEPTTGAPLLPKGADTARMQAKYTSLLMGLKDLYTLGALTGPDMSIIESQINNPASWAGKLTTYNGIKEQTQVIEDMLRRSTQNVENSYGRKPNATLKALEPLRNLPGASDSDPLGILKGKP